MALMTGDSVRETGLYHCDKCKRDVQLKKGDKAPKCPKCGNTTFKETKPVVSGAQKH